MRDIKELIAKQKAELGVSKYSSDVEVALGGELLTLSFEKALPDAWDLLVGMNPPRPGLEYDAMLGYNAKGVSSDYPKRLSENVKPPEVLVDGEPIDPDDWADMYKVLDSTHRNNIETVIWGINVNETLREMLELGKGQASKK